MRSMPPADGIHPRPRVLFLGHGAERTGPPVLLLRLCRWLRENTEMGIEFVLLEGGPMLEEFEALGSVHVLDEVDPCRRDQVLSAVAARLGARRLATRLGCRHLRRALRRVADPNLVYVNTAGSVRALRHLTIVDGCPVISHVHELSVGLEHFLGSADLELLLARTDHFLVVSNAVRGYVQDALGIAADRVEVQPGFIDPPVAPAPTSSIPWPDGALVVGACGSTGWRKAPDLLLAIAAELHHRRPELPVHFAWVGGGTGEGSTEAAVERDAETTGLATRFHFLGPVDDPAPWFRRFDVFALPSREDAFPLVGMEAAAAGLPIVCFDRGGLPELVEASGGGYVVPYPDLAAFARLLADLLEDPEERDRLGSAGRDYVLAHLTTSVRAPALARTIAEMHAGARVSDVEPW